MQRQPTVFINPSALAHNLQHIRHLAPNTTLMAVVKANAYGHGVDILLPTLSEYADSLGVACMQEALSLRELGFRKPITLLEGVCNAEEYQLAAQHHLHCVIHHAQQLTWLQRVNLVNKIHIWLKLDSGMGRLGFTPHAFTEVYQQLQTLPWVQQPLGLMTHFAEADELTSAKTQQQWLCFKQTTQGLTGVISAANSAAVLAHSHTQGDCIRPGIMCYGISPFAHKTAADFGLKPVMELRSNIITVKTLQAGDSVGYGSTWTCKDKTRLGIVAMGYGDGYPRHAENGTPVLVNGYEVPLIGRVSMDMLAVDLSAYPHLHVGDPVTLWGGDLAVERVAAHANTIAYELVCKVGTRVRRNK